MACLSFIPLFMLFGVLLGLTPCAIPLVLIMTSICNANDAKQKLSVAIVYLLSLGIAYGIVGLFITILGHYLQNYLRETVIILAMSLFFLFLGLSTLGLMYLQLFPHKWLLSIKQFQQNHLRNPYLEAVFIGSTATLMASPCVTAPLAGLLYYVATSNNILSGTLILFFTGIGFGLPVLALTLFGTELLQHAGKWQKLIKQFFGLSLIGVSIQILKLDISPSFSMLLWATFCIFSGIYMGALITDEENPLITKALQQEQCHLDGEDTSIKKRQLLKNIRSITKMISLLILLYGVLLFVGFLLGNQNPLSPLNFSTIIHKV